MSKPRKHPSSRMSALAARILGDPEYGYTREQVRKLAACVLSLDVTPGPNEPGTADD